MQEIALEMLMNVKVYGISSVFARLKYGHGKMTLFLIC